MNRQATLNALVWDPSTATISVRCTVTFHQDIASWIYYVLATAAILQNDLAHAHTVALAKASGGQPAGFNHPTQGVRNDANTSMDIPARLILPAGEEPSKFVGARCAGIEGFLADLAETKGGTAMPMAMAQLSKFRSSATGQRYSRIAALPMTDSKPHWCRCSPITPTPISETAHL